jgi:hypothetical protein
MKRLLIVTLFAALAVSAFGIDLSVGAGMSVGGFSATEYYEDYLVIYDVLKIQDVTVPYGVMAWFDATYGTVAVGFRANGNVHTTITSDGFLGPDSSETDTDERWGYLSFALLGRYPFALGPLSLFPLLGIEYDLNLYWKDVDGGDLKAALPEEEKAWLNQVWFKAGVGADIVLSKGLFVRPLVLLGFKVLNADERETLQNAIDPGGANVARKTNFVLEAGVQAGWRF